ncbi:MAG: RNA polymerase sigma factor [Zavarzinella sp.]
MRLNQEDAALVKRCLAREPGAVETLVDTYSNQVYAVCLRYLRHAQDAEDITQETLVRAIRNLHQWDPERPLKPWLYRIAVNRCKTLLARKPLNTVAPEVLQATTCTRTHDGDGDELLENIHLALLQVRDDYRSAFLLFHEQGCSYEEIAEIHEHPVGTIKTWLYRTRGVVFAYLKEKELLPADMDRPNA